MAKILTGKNTSKKEVILQKAASLFKSKSYSAASMRELADIVGVEASSLYNHIGSKSELLQDICFKTGYQFLEQIEKIKNSSNSNVEKIETVIRFHIKTMAENFDEVYVANHEWKHLEEPYLTDFLNIRRNYEKSLMSFIETGIEEKEIRLVNSYVAMLTILSAVRGLEFWQRSKKNVPLQVLENDMVNQLLNGITK
ncbi:MAG: TetR/AcrR family transcriptional regulator [Chitinophagaceae bacterium]|nr:TetR/AcrR family transcriptional regulator [Chitinophagaceae bacterium]